MVAHTQNLDELVAQIASIGTIEESNQVRDAMRSFKDFASEQDYETARRALSKRLNELADLSNTQQQEAVNSLRVNGIVYNLDEWLTIANYAKKYNTSTHVITNNIRRGNIPASCVVEVPFLNNIRMIKDQPYR